MNNYQAQSVVIGVAMAEALLARLQGSSMGPIAPTATVHLSHDTAYNPTPDGDPSVYASAECTASGVAAVSLVMVDPVNLSSNCKGAIDPVSFLADNTVPFLSDVATGYWVEQSGNLLWAERFADNEQANFASTGDYLELGVAFPVQLHQDTV